MQAEEAKAAETMSVAKDNLRIGLLNMVFSFVCYYYEAKVLYVYKYTGFVYITQQKYDYFYKILFVLGRMCIRLSKNILVTVVT